ncbi:MAG: MBOAT family protein [Clostridiales bacterium]|nr:MBOAT family protein [Clostridiales bacterium]
MLFSSLTFLLYFMPLVILIHYILPKKLQNGFLLLASLVFYSWGEATKVPLFALLLFANWGIGRLMDLPKIQPYRRLILLAGLVLDLGALIYYKYIGFLMENLGLDAAFAKDITLPLGISFFTFQAVGYLVDVYRRQTPPEKSFINFGAFLFMFPQLIAGPIIRYSDMSTALHQKRRPSAKMLESGMALMVAGLAAKVLIANPLGEAFATLRTIHSDALCAWMSLAASVMQIYFDFMGYSVMAVGLGRMMGFEFTRNFNHPFASKSITEFWRRWHITLSKWFRDYVYIPLGGSRRSLPRTLLNTFVVWALTGLWHGASWNFVLWGVSFFVLLIMEKYTEKLRASWPGWLSYIVTILLLSLNFPFFICDDLSIYGQFISDMWCFNFTTESLFWLREYAGIIALGVVFCIPKVVNGLKRLCRKYAWLRMACVLGALILCLASLVKSSYNPFLYFRF